MTLSSLLTASALLALPALSLAEPGEDRVLVVGVTKGKSFDGRLTKSLSDHLQRLGSVQVIRHELSASERLCTDQECLESVARRTGAELLISAVMQQNGPASYYITLGLFDATRRAPFQDSVLCEQCEPEALLAKLSDATDELIKKSVASRTKKPLPKVSAPVELLAPVTSAAVPTPVLPPAPPTSPVRPIPTLVAEDPETLPESLGSRTVEASPLVPFPPPPPPASSGLSRDRKILAGILGGTTVLALGAAIATHVLDGGQAPDSSCILDQNRITDGCVYRNSALYATGYGVAAASAIGLSFTLFWPSGSKKETPSQQLPMPTTSSQNALSTEVR